LVPPAFAPVYDRRFFFDEKRVERPSNRTMACTPSSVQCSSLCI
jgi:hypothetical protein